MLYALWSDTWSCSSYWDLPPVMIQGHEQQPGGDDDDGDVCGDDVDSHNL